MVRVWPSLLAVPVLAAGWAAVHAAGSPAGPSRPIDRLGPIVVGAEDKGGEEALKAPPRTGTPKPAPPVRLDESARTVRVPARLTRARGVVEWLLSAGGRHAGASVLVTDCSVRDVADALAKVGLAGGDRPVPVGDDRVRPPRGTPVEIEVVFASADGKETRVPAARLLSARSGGEPLADGAWVHVGPAVVREADGEILVTELSGSLATTDLRDSSALIYRVPAGGETVPFVKACYASGEALPGATACEVLIRPGAGGPPAAPSPPPARPAASEPRP